MIKSIELLRTQNEGIASQLEQLLSVPIPYYIHFAYVLAMSHQSLIVLGSTGGQVSQCHPSSHRGLGVPITI